MNSQPHSTVPGLEAQDARAVVEALEDRLVSLIDLHLTLKHVHWNVVGPSFLSVHEMLDTMVGPVRRMTDEVAERMRTLGGVPRGTPAAVAASRRWNDYDLGTESVYVHLKELDGVFAGVIADHRAAVATTSELDPVTEDLLVSQTAELEHFQWFIRSFFERAHDVDEATHGHTSAATTAADERDARSGSGADRSPTDEEARAAERAAASVDRAGTAEHYEEMTSVGAEVRGEGGI